VSANLATLSFKEDIMNILSVIVSVIIGAITVAVIAAVSNTSVAVIPAVAGVVAIAAIIQAFVASIPPRSARDIKTMNYAMTIGIVAMVILVAIKLSN
jgi:hypothetical protein